MLCILVGYWAPWVGHPAAGLVQNAFDLSEFVKFLPQVRNGDEPLLRWLFFLPLPTVAVSLSLWVIMEGRFYLCSRVTRSLRPGLVVLSLPLLAVLIPPYPYTPARLLGDEFRARTILTVVSWAAFALTLVWLGRWLARRPALILLAVLTLVGTISPMVQFLSLRDELSSVYGRPIIIGWGMWLMLAGMLVVLGGAALGFRQAEKVVNARPRDGSAD